MRLAICLATTLALSGPYADAFASGADFSGKWDIDIRTPAERKQNVACGHARFVLVQTGDRIDGDHTMATPGCGRLNEGGEGSVKGIVVGSTAVLVVTSGRNGGIFVGTARLRKGVLVWTIKEEIRPGAPEGDSPLILGKGSLTRTTEGQ